MAPAMISPLSKALWTLITICGSTSIGFAQSTFIEVHSTPYDRQMKRIQSTLTTPSAQATYGPSLAVVNQWMINLRAMPYQYSREWKTPFEVETAKVGDCKGKAVVLYDWMQLNGARNVRLVIGRRYTGDPLTHAWLEWQTRIGTLLLDPTFNWDAAIKLRNRGSYIALYGYERGHKYLAADSLLATRAVATRAPAAPAHGAITRPVPSASRFPSSSASGFRASWPGLAQGPADPQFFRNRPAL
jgi:hypothetical protein